MLTSYQKQKRLEILTLSETVIISRETSRSIFDLVKSETYFENSLLPWRFPFQICSHDLYS